MPKRKAARSLTEAQKEHFRKLAITRELSDVRSSDDENNNFSLTTNLYRSMQPPTTLALPRINDENKPDMYTPSLVGFSPVIAPSPVPRNPLQDLNPNAAALAPNPVATPAAPVVPALVIKKPSVAAAANNATPIVATQKAAAAPPTPPRTANGVANYEPTDLEIYTCRLVARAKIDEMIKEGKIDLDSLDDKLRAESINIRTEKLMNMWLESARERRYKIASPSHDPLNTPHRATP